MIPPTGASWCGGGHACHGASGPPAGQREHGVERLREHSERARRGVRGHLVLREMQLAAAVDDLDARVVAAAELATRRLRPETAGPH